MYLGATDLKVNDQGIPVQLVGDTYLPQGGITTNPTGKGWYEVYQNGIYVGYLKPGGKNGIFVAQGSPVIWPTPSVSTPTANTPTVTTQVAPAPIPSRTESIPTSASNVAPPTAVSTLAPSSGGQSIIELPSTAVPIEETPSTTAVDTVTPASKIPSWILWSTLGGIALVMIKRGKTRGRK